MNTVNDLIMTLSQLSEEDRKKVVWLEGCDCTNEWGGSATQGYEDDIVLDICI